MVMTDSFMAEIKLNLGGDLCSADHPLDGTCAPNVRPPITNYTFITSRTKCKNVRTYIQAINTDRDRWEDAVTFYVYFNVSTWEGVYFKGLIVFRNISILALTVQHNPRVFY